MTHHMFIGSPFADVDHGDNGADPQRERSESNEAIRPAHACSQLVYSALPIS
jgi:hypothetical protein